MAGKRSLAEMDSEETVTLQEVFLEHERLEKEAAQALEEQWGEEGCCTFEQGSINQNVFACATCQAIPGNQPSFGFCFGCSMQCHVGHEVYELFQKRNFRCDCGVSQCGSCELLQIGRASCRERV